MKDSGPNWGLAFGSASFLIVWCLGFLSGVSIEVTAIRACVATVLGALLGLLLTQILNSVQTTEKEEEGPAKGQQVDFTLPADDLELGASVPGERTSVVPQAPGSSVPSANTPEAFQPLDFKKAARQVQSNMKE